jgi:hypothetical protein
MGAIEKLFGKSKCGPGLQGSYSMMTRALIGSNQSNAKRYMYK